jgi:hypothetical protein
LLRWLQVGMFSLMAALIFADQNLLAPNLTQAGRRGLQLKTL